MHRARTFSAEAARADQIEIMAARVGMWEQFSDWFYDLFKYWMIKVAARRIIVELF